MQKAHDNINWENYPSEESPINEYNLNKMDRSIDVIDDRVLTLDITKLEKADAQMFVKQIQFNRETGVFKIVYFNNSFDIIDTELEKLAVNFDYDEQEQKLIVFHDDGTKKYVDLSALITQHEFLSSDTITTIVDDAGRVSADIKEGSIQEKHLRPNYLADIKVETAKVQASQSAATLAATNAKASEVAAKESEEAAVSAAAGALASQEAATGSASAAKAAEDAAKASEADARESATRAEEAAGRAEAAEDAAKENAQSAAQKAADAADSADKAEAAETGAEEYAGLSKSYAVGTGGEVRENDETDNADFYCQQSHSYRDEAEKFMQSGSEILQQIIKRAELAEFSIDDDGNLVYTDNGDFVFTVNDDGDLTWEVA